MGEYNQAVAWSTVTDASGLPGPQAVEINNLRMDFVEKWIGANTVDKNALTQEEKDKLKCVLRVANRLGVDIGGENSIVLRFLSSKVAYRSGCTVDPQSEALRRLRAILLGFYNQDKGYLDSVDLQR